MKKLVFMFVAVVAISFASCNENKATQEAPATDSTEVTTDSTAAPADSTEAAADSTSSDSTKA